jgi:hypothetical protein
MKLKSLLSISLLLMLFAATAQVVDATGSVTISGRTSSKLCLWNDATGMVPDQTVVVDSFPLSVSSAPLPEKSTVLGVKSNVMKWYVKAQASLESTDPLANSILAKVSYTVQPVSGPEVWIPAAGGTLADLAEKRVICQGSTPTERTLIQTNYRLTAPVQDSLVAVVRYSLEAVP